MGEILVADTEANGLLDAVTKFHTLQLGALDEGQVTVYADHMLGDRPLKEGLERLSAADTVYMHNAIGYDEQLLEKFFPGVLDVSKVRDTLIMSRMAFPHERQHSLKVWGERLGATKGDYEGDFAEITVDLVSYARQDVVAGRALTKHLLAHLDGCEAALDTEHSFARWMQRMEKTGFHLDVEGAEKLYVDLLAQKREMERELAKAFPPRWVSLGTKVSGATNKTFGYTKGVEFTVVEYDEFSPSSRQAIARRLEERGWKPKDRTPNGQPVVDEDVLKSLAPRFPEAATLARYFDVEKQASAVGGDNGWLRLQKNGVVHGRITTLGAYTARCSHSKPNLAQVPKKGGFRSLWLPRPGWWLVGCDAEAIQGRGLAHYLFPWDDGKYADIIVNGKKSVTVDGQTFKLDDIENLPVSEVASRGLWCSEIHSQNTKAIHAVVGWPKGMSLKHARDTSKNENYALFFGAQDPRLGQTYKDGILGYAKLTPPKVPNKELGAAIRRGIGLNMVGLFGPTDKRRKGLIETVEDTYESRGFLRGLDGRKLFPPNRRNAFVTLIQSFEAIAMKKAFTIFCDEAAPERGWVYGEHYELVASVHDEGQLQAPTEELAYEVGDAFAKAIATAGERLGSRCPLAGDRKVGKSWHSTH